MKNEPVREVPVFPARPERLANQPPGAGKADPAREVPVFPARPGRLVHAQPVVNSMDPTASLHLVEVAHDASLHIEADPGADEWEWIAPPTGPSAHIDCSGIRVTADLPAERRAAIEGLRGVRIAPLVVAGHEIGYRLQGGADARDTVLVSCHGYGVGQGVFSKPTDIEFRFAAPRNTLLLSNTRGFAERLRDRPLTDQDGSQIYGADVRYAVDYELSGGVDMTVESAAEFLQKMREKGTPLPFDIVLVNSFAEGVHFSHLTQALQASLDGKLRTLIAHFCRRQGDDARVFDALD